MDLEPRAAERDEATLFWTGFEAEGEEGELQFRRRSNQHRRHRLQVAVPLEAELD